MPEKVCLLRRDLTSPSIAVVVFSGKILMAFTTLLTYVRLFNFIYCFYVIRPNLARACEDVPEIPLSNHYFTIWTLFLAHFTHAQFNTGIQ